MPRTGASLTYAARLLSQKRSPAMHTEASHPNFHAAKNVLTVVALASALSFTVWANSARAADDTTSGQLAAAACSLSLPALEQAGYSAQTGHLQALKTL